MDISKLVEGAWLELYPADERIGPVRLKVNPLPTDTRIDPDVVDGAALIEKVTRLVLDWNFESNGEKIECTPETRQKYMGNILRLELKSDTEEKAYVAWELIKFCASIDNFLKN